MEIIVALTVGLFLSNAIWFIFYKASVEKQISILKKYKESLQKQNDYLVKTEKEAIEFSKSLNETVRLVTENHKLCKNLE